MIRSSFATCPAAGEACADHQACDCYQCPSCRFRHHRDVEAVIGELGTVVVEHGIEFEGQCLELRQGRQRRSGKSAALWIMKGQLNWIGRRCLRCNQEYHPVRFDALANRRGTVQVGFNRRFAPASIELKRLLADIAGPKSASFRVSPGKLDPHHWYANYQESGGRVLGEACHFLDYFCFLFGSDPVRVLAQTTWPASGRLPFPDSVTAQVEFADGSCGQLIYSAEGDSSWPKEKLTVFGAGMVAEITNFQELLVHQNRKRKSHSYTSKGHAEQMAAWLALLRGQAEHPLPYQESRQSLLLTFAVLESIQQARAVEPK
jgi:hypothetical protein